MDNLCHTLVGAAIGKTGLERRSALSTATVLIGANLPDIDAFVAMAGVDSLSFRRGITHGVLALVVWPFILTGAMMLWDRYVRRRGGRLPAEPVRPRALLLLATLAILSHPFLDWMNTYGMRWLMPFSGRWFYADVLFIIDPWIWMTLGLSLVMAGRSVVDSGWSARGRSARIALAAVSAYIAAMAALTIAGRVALRDALAGRGIDPVAPVLVSPVPVNSLRRELLVDAGDHYLFGTLEWSPGPRITLSEPTMPKNADTPQARAAAATPEGARFLDWARFPYYRIQSAGDSVLVFIGDARYNRMAGRTWASVTVRIPQQ